MESNREEEAKFELYKKYGHPPINISLQEIKEKKYPMSFVDGFSFTITEDKGKFEPIYEKVDAWDACLFDSKEWFNTMTERKK